MPDIEIINIADLPTQKEPNISMFAVITDPVSGKSFKVPYEEIKKLLGVEALESGVGVAIPGGTPSGNVFIYEARIAGTYTNYGGIVVTSGDLDGKVVRFYHIGSTWYKEVKAVADLALYTKLIDFNSVKAVTDKFPTVNGKNLLNKNDITLGKGISNTDGSIVTNGGVATWAIFNPIPVTPGTQYTFSGGVALIDSRVRFEDASHTLISFANASAKPFTFTTPPACVYLVIPAHTGVTAIMDTAQLELGTAATTYVAYVSPKLSAQSLSLVEYLKVSDADVKFVSLDTPGKNKLNLLEIEEGKAIANDGAVVSNATYSLSGYIPVLPLTTYTYSGTLASSSFARGSFYDTNKAFLSVYLPPDGNMPKVFTTPANCFFVRINTKAGSTVTYSTLQIEKGNTPTTYEAFKKVVDPAKLPLEEYAKFSLIDTEYAKKSLLKTQYIDTASLNVGQATGPAGQLLSNANWANFKPLIVLSEATYVFSTEMAAVDVRIRFEDANHTLISFIQASVLPITFNTPAGCAFVVLPAWNNNETTKALTATLKPINPAVIESFSRWFGKKWVFFGDSMVFNDRFQKIIVSRLSITYVNDAVAGSCVASGKEDVEPDAIHRTALVTRADGIDLLAPTGGIFIFASTNDWYYNVPLGAITDTVDNTFYGAYKILLQKLQVQNPGIRIAASTMLQRTNSRANYSSQKAYSDAVKEVCAMYAVPCYDAFAKSGITYENISQYTTDNVHPKAPEGDKLLGEQFAAFINSL